MKSWGIKLKAKSESTFFHILCKEAGELAVSGCFAISTNGTEQDEMNVYKKGSKMANKHSGE